MAILKFIREAKDSHLLLLGIIEEGESANYTVNTVTFREIGSPSVGDELNSSQMSSITYADQLIKAKKKALSILAYADNNRKNLALKLSRAGFSREIVDSVCDEMVELGYINERNQLERLILIEANRKLRGPSRIVAFLVSKGYSSSKIKEVMSMLVREGEIDFNSNARALLEKKMPDDADEDEVKKILYKNGFKI